MTGQLIIDLSSNNKFSDLEGVISNPAIHGFVVKVTESDDYAWEEAGRIVQLCHKHGKPVSGYHFFHPETPILKQVAWLKDHHFGLKRIWVDAELNAHGEPDLAMSKTDWEYCGRVTHEFMHHINAFVSVGIYTGNEYLGNTGAPWNAPLWYANYPAVAPGPNAIPPHPCQMWQYRSDGRIAGIIGDVDCSYFYPLVVKDSLAKVFNGEAK